MPKKVKDTHELVVGHLLGTCFLKVNSQENGRPKLPIMPDDKHEIVIDYNRIAESAPKKEEYFAQPRVIEDDEESTDHADEQIMNYLRSEGFIGVGGNWSISTLQKPKKA